MNRLQANICLLCVTLCWSLEVILYACIPSGIPAFATSCVTCLAGAALLFVPFRGRVATEIRAGGWRFLAATLGLALLSSTYNTLFLHGLKSFDVASGAFTFCMTAIVVPAVALVYPKIDIGFLTKAVFGNTAGFPIVFGIPLAILMQEEFGFKAMRANYKHFAQNGVVSSARMCDNCPAPKNCAPCHHKPKGTRA